MKSSHDELTKLATACSEESMWRSFLDHIMYLILDGTRLPVEQMQDCSGGRAGKNPRTAARLANYKAFAKLP